MRYLLSVGRPLQEAPLSHGVQKRRHRVWADLRRRSRRLGIEAVHKHQQASQDALFLFAKHVG
jgi:hypothetical protein